MSIHKSFKRNRFKEHRTVRTRRERVEKLIKNLKWVKGQSPYGLPKEVIRKLELKIKKEEKPKKSLVEMALGLPTKAESTKKKKTSKDDRKNTRR